MACTQVDLFKSVCVEGPRLVLLRSPPDTGKTSMAPCLPELFPDERHVFCCLARRVNLEVAQTLYNMGIPFAWVHNRQITCSWLCGLRGASTSTSLAQMEEKLKLGVERIQATAGGLSNGRVRKRHQQVIRPGAHRTCIPCMYTQTHLSCVWHVHCMHTQVRRQVAPALERTTAQGLVHPVQVGGQEGHAPRDGHALGAVRPRSHALMSHSHA